MMQLISTHLCKMQNVGFHGNLFGGTMLSWLDEAGGSYVAEVCQTPRVVTVKLTEVEFKKPVRPGQIIKIYGKVLKIGNCSIIVKLEARRHSPYNGSQKVVCSTEMTFVRIDGDGEPVAIQENIKTQYASN